MPVFSDLQKRIAYILFAGSLAIASLFFALAQGAAGNTSAPKPSVTGLNFIGPTALPAITSPGPSASDVVVDVAGKVLHPGLYHLSTGARVFDAISKAGGALKGVALTDLNLAAPIVDGEQILVDGLAPNQAINSAASGGSRSSLSSRGLSKSKGKSSTAVVSINSATSAAFQQLSGIGPVLAGRILSYRSAHGHFATLDDLRKVAGMSLKKFNAIKKQLRL